MACVAFNLVLLACVAVCSSLWRVSPSKFVFMACVALQVCFPGVCRLLFSLDGVCRRLN